NTPLPEIAFAIDGSSLSDPIGPILVNPTNSPTGFSSKLGGLYYYFALPVPVFTPNAYLIYFPGLPLTQASNVISDPGTAGNGSGLSWSAGASLPVARAAATAHSFGAGIFVFGGVTPAGLTTAVLQGDGASAWTTNPVRLDRGYVSAAIGETHSLGPTTADGFK